MAIVEEVNLLLAALHKGFSIGAFYGRLLWGGYRVNCCHRFACADLVNFLGSS
jgi:hypothetical protein